MPEFEDFRKTVENVKAVGITAEELRKKATGQSQEMIDLAKMMIDVRKEVKEIETESSEEFVNALKSIDDKFGEYFSNIKDLGETLDKFVDPKYKMNKEEAARMKELIDLDKSLSNEISAMREANEEYNSSILAVEEKFGRSIEKQGVFEEEQAVIRKKYNLKTGEVWEKISSNIGVMSTELMGELKETFLMGVGGPYAILLKDILSPVWDKFKESTIYQTATEKIKGIFGRKAEEEVEVGEIEDATEIAEEVADKVAFEPDELVNGFMAKSPIFQKNAFDMMGDKFSVALEEIENLLSMQLEVVRNLPEDLVRVMAGHEKLGSLSSDEMNLLESDTTGNALDKLVSEAQESGARERILQGEYYGDLMQLQQDMWVEESEHRELERDFYQKILENLDDFGGEGEGGGDFLKGLGLGAFATQLKKLAPLLLRFAGVLGPVIAMLTFKGDTGPKEAAFYSMEKYIRKASLVKSMPEKYPEIVELLNEAEKITDPKAYGMALAAALSEVDIGELLMAQYGKQVAGETQVNFEDLLKSQLEISEADLRDMIKAGAAVRIGGKRVIEPGQQRLGAKGYQRILREYGVADAIKKHNLLVQTQDVTDFSRFEDEYEEAIRTFEEHEQQDIQRAQERLDNLQKQEDARVKRESSESTSVIMNQGERRKQQELDDVGVIELDGVIALFNSGKLGNQ